MAAGRERSFEDTYSIRWYDADDREAFLSLYDDAFGGGSDDWFEWKYLDNPYVSHVPILVAESNDGAFAGARPQVPFRMQAGDERPLVLRFGDTMVHPDHRRRGVFSNLTRRALDHYEQGAPRLCFNCPNDLSRPGFLDAGGHLVTELPSFYRVQRPGALLDDAPAESVVDGLGRAAVRGYHAVRRMGASTPDGVTVTRHDGIPVDLLADCYERGAPPGIHAVRDREFLRWRYRNPMWEYAVHTASDDDGRTIAALVTGRGTDDGVDVATVVDALPLVDDEDRSRGLRALLAAVLPRYDDADVVAYSGRTIPRDVLSAFGFLPDDSLPLSKVASPSTLVAYDIGNDAPAWSVGGLDPRDPSAWNLSFAELDAH